MKQPVHRLAANKVAKPKFPVCALRVIKTTHPAEAHYLWSLPWRFPRPPPAPPSPQGSQILWLSSPWVSRVTKEHGLKLLSQQKGGRRGKRFCRVLMRGLGAHPRRQIPTRVFPRRPRRGAPGWCQLQPRLCRFCSVTSIQSLLLDLTEVLELPAHAESPN